MRFWFDGKGTVTKRKVVFTTFKEMVLAPSFFMIFM